MTDDDKFRRLALAIQKMSECVALLTKSVTDMGNNIEILRNHIERATGKKLDVTEESDPGSWGVYQNIKERKQ